jgi:hypothetical protein
MDTQSVLNLMIQAVVMGIVTLMIFDFIGGLWVVPLPPAGWQPPVIEPATVSAVAPQPTPQQEISQPTLAIAPQFEEIPDPWTLQPQSSHHSAPAVIVSFPALRLLPPAQEVQPTKTKRRTSKPSKSTQSKSPKEPKPRKKAA